MKTPMQSQWSIYPFNILSNDLFPLGFGHSLMGSFHTRIIVYEIVILIEPNRDWRFYCIYVRVSISSDILYTCYFELCICVCVYLVYRLGWGIIVNWFWWQYLAHNHWRWRSHSISVMYSSWNYNESSDIKSKWHVNTNVRQHYRPMWTQYVIVSAKSIWNYNVLNEEKQKQKPLYMKIENDSFPRRWQRIQHLDTKTTKSNMKTQQNIPICQNIDNFIILYLWSNVSIAVDNYRRNLFICFQSTYGKVLIATVYIAWWPANKWSNQRNVYIEYIHWL